MLQLKIYELTEQTYKIHEVDKRILRYQIENTRMPFTEIAKKMDVSSGTIHVRVKKLEDEGIIKG
ncbi:winged helix-turn-helix transcriptional regulator, partial [Ornithobacterium rhinotracheale]